jgi:Mor family transcriptional regulator
MPEDGLKEIAAEMTIDLLPEKYRPVAETLGMEQALRLAMSFPGMQIYVPKISTLTSDLRDRKIRAEFTGCNHRELARKYGRSEPWIRRLCSASRPTRRPTCSRMRKSMDDSGYMTCNRMHARIPITTCIGRQTKGISFGEGYRNPPPECQNCEQGILAMSEMKIQEQKIKENKPMTRKGICKNCGREKFITGDGCCGVCYLAGKGLEGEEKAEALAKIKEKISSGKMRTGRRKSADAAPGTPLPSGLIQVEGPGTLAPQVVPVTVRLTLEVSVRIV